MREELSLSMAAGAPGESQREPSRLRHPTQSGAGCSFQRKTSPFFHCRFLLPNPGYVSTHMCCSGCGLPRLWPALGLRK